MSTFETGAKTASSNNLILSVLNDGAIYESRKHCGFALLVGINASLSISDIVKNEAKKQRITGSKFSAYDLSEATKLIIKDTVIHCLELIRDEYDGSEIKAHIRRWFDKINGNSYFAVHVKIGKYAINLPFQYGYGSQPEHETRELLKLIGIENPIIDFSDRGYGLKRDLFEGLYINEAYIK